MSAQALTRNNLIDDLFVRLCAMLCAEGADPGDMCYSVTGVYSDMKMIIYEMESPEVCQVCGFSGGKSEFEHVTQLGKGKLISWLCPKCGIGNDYIPF